MKTAIRILAAALLLAALSSCQLSHSTGLIGSLVLGDTARTSLRVIDGVPNLLVTGTVQVTIGQLEVVLKPPHGAEQTVGTYGIGPAVVDFAVSSPDAGTWELRIQSVNGAGDYSLRMYY